MGGDSDRAWLSRYMTKLINQQPDRSGAERQPQPVAPIVALAAEVRRSGHLHNLSYGHRRLGSLSASTERSTPVSCALTQQDTAPPCMKRMRSHQADEYVAVITCVRSRPETRSGREAGGSTKPDMLATFEPSRPTASPQAATRPWITR